MGWRGMRALAPILAFLVVATARAAADGPTIEVFTRAGCPRCEAAARFLTALQAERPELGITYLRVDQDRDALARLRRLGAEAGTATVGVPTFRIGRSLVVGFADDATTGERLRALLDGDAADAGAADVCPPSPDGACITPLAQDDQVTTRLFGTIGAADLGLPAFTIALGLLDGFNPCAMWVLLLLLSLLVNLRDRRRMAVIAATFVVVSGLMYFAFMAAWLNVFLLVGVSRPAQLVLGALACAAGLLNLKDAAAIGRGPSLSIPDGAKPGIYARARRVLTAESLGPAVVAVAALAVLVNLVELLCTAGFPAVYTAVLARQPVPPAAHYGYLALYNLAYVADDALMVSLAVATLGRHKLSGGEGRWLKLASGLVMLALGAALVGRPDLLAM